MIHTDRITITLCIFLILIGPLSFAQIPKGVFAEYAGAWEGTFYVRSPDGKIVKTLHAKHVYKNIDPYTLKGTQTITYPDGSRETVQARDYVENGKLYCRVESDRSGVKVLEGYLDGKDIFWSRKDTNTIETFRERIIAGNTYAIDGYGIYGKNIYTFHAEYKRVKE